MTDNIKNDTITFFFFLIIRTFDMCVLSDITPNQMHQVTLDPIEKVKLTWMVDWPEKNVFFQLKNGINERFTWFAIGFSRRGDLPLTGEKKILKKKKILQEAQLVKLSSQSCSISPLKIIIKSSLCLCLFLADFCIFQRESDRIDTSIVSVINHHFC